MIQLLAVSLKDENLLLEDQTSQVMMQMHPDPSGRLCWAHRYVTTQETGRNGKLFRNVEPAGLVSERGAQCLLYCLAQVDYGFGGSWPSASVRPIPLIYSEPKKRKDLAAYLRRRPMGGC